MDPNHPSDDAWSVQAKQMLLNFANQIELPDRCVEFLNTVLWKLSMYSIEIKYVLIMFAVLHFASPLDQLIDKLGGPSNVAEMTGRRARIIRYHPDDKPFYEVRENDSGEVESLNVKEVRILVLF